ncbi:hypothetical protein [Archaeoglobus neptunius]|uniref:hypothetical protein n=1 Tax=Archaeoglobus neptunius TaxID=2798580 RepID=UPI001928743C|nr:hypothetical protein [Archaeoglobus neptunius]
MYKFHHRTIYVNEKVDKMIECAKEWKINMRAFERLFVNLGLEFPTLRDLGKIVKVHTSTHPGRLRVYRLEKVLKRFGLHLARVERIEGDIILSFVKGCRTRWVEFLEMVDNTPQDF